MNSPRIIELDKSVVNKIAAGEIINEPFNVIKELMENSIDAQSKKIEINVEDSGYGLIKIKDDGCGINVSDLPIVCARHTTSKLKKVSDLSTIGTFGFRGEALFSMSCCSHLTIYSKTRDDTNGYMGKYCDGKLIENITKAATTNGTTIEIRDLFYNNQIRLESRPKPNVDSKKLIDLVSKYAVVYPYISFKFTSGTKEYIQTYGCGTPEEVLKLVFKIEQNDMFFRVDSSPIPNSFVSLHLSTPTTTTKKVINAIFINGRLVSCPDIKRVVENAYCDMIGNGIKPSYFIILKLPQEDIDVNIHPSKKVVKFSMELELCECLRDTIRESLEQRRYKRPSISLKESLPKKKRVFDDSSQQKIDVSFNFASPSNQPKSEESEVFTKESVSSTTTNNISNIDGSFLNDCTVEDNYKHDETSSVNKNVSKNKENEKINEQSLSPRDMARLQLGLDPISAKPSNSSRSLDNDKYSEKNLSVKGESDKINQYSEKTLSESCDNNENEHKGMELGIDSNVKTIEQNVRVETTSKKVLEINMKFTPDKNCSETKSDMIHKENNHGTKADDHQNKCEDVQYNDIKSLVDIICNDFGNDDNVKKNVNEVTCCDDEQKSKEVTMSGISDECVDEDKVSQPDLFPKKKQSAQTPSPTKLKTQLFNEIKRSKTPKIQRDPSMKSIEELFTPISIIPKPYRKVELQSIISMRNELLSKTDNNIERIFKSHELVGNSGFSYFYIRSGDVLYICNTFGVLKDLFKFRILDLFQNFSQLRLDPPVDLTKYEPEISNTLQTNSVMLLDYFSISIENNKIYSMPAIVVGYRPSFSGIYLFLKNLAFKVKWEEEYSCLHQIIEELSCLYCPLPIDELNESESKRIKGELSNLVIPLLKSDRYHPTLDVTPSVVRLCTSLLLHSLFE